jgi:hypothetical protein
VARVFAACTVVARNYLAQTRVLATSFREHHPDAEFVVVVIDNDGTIGPDEPFALVRPDELIDDRVELHRRGAMFGPRGLMGTLRPLLVRRLAHDYDTVLLLDADACIYGDLAHAVSRADEHGLVLTPHLSSPVSTSDAGYPLEETFLKFGVFNGGFVAVSAKARAFLDWWCDRTSRHCIEAPEQGYNYTQHWLTLAPAYFDHDVLRDPGISAMWWNLYDRDVDWSGDAPSISGVPLRHFHFTGFDPAEGTLLGRRDETARASFPGLELRPGLARLCSEYADRVVAAGLDDAARTPLPFVHLADGTLFSDEARTHYREAVEWAEISGGVEPPNPFVVDG